MFYADLIQLYQALYTSIVFIWSEHPYIAVSVYAINVGMYLKNVEANMQRKCIYIGHSGVLDAVA